MKTILILVTTLAIPTTLMLVGRAHRRRETGRSTLTLKRAIAGHVLIVGLLYFGTLGWALNAAPASPPQEAAEIVSSGQLSLGDGLGLLGVAMATGLSVLGAGYAVGLVGSAALGVIAEKPELFGRTLVFIGLAEGLAIYGLVLSILILGRV